MPLQLEIVTPTHKAYSGAVDMVVIPGVDGELGILPQHIPLMTMITPGELAVTKDGQTHYLAVGAGFAEVTPTEVIIVTDMATNEEDIDEAAVQEAIARAEAKLKETALLEEDERDALQVEIQDSLAQLLVKSHRRR